MMQGLGSMEKVLSVSGLSTFCQLLDVSNDQSTSEMWVKSLVDT